MSSATLGSGISAPEVTGVSASGFWLRVDGTTWFVDFGAFPWFRGAGSSQLRNVERPAPHHLRWPDLDVDLALESIRNPAAFPLVSQPDRR